MTNVFDPHKENILRFISRSSVEAIYSKNFGSTDVMDLGSWNWIRRSFGTDFFDLHQRAARNRNCLLTEKEQEIIEMFYRCFHQEVIIDLDEDDDDCI